MNESTNEPTRSEGLLRRGGGNCKKFPQPFAPSFRFSFALNPTIYKITSILTTPVSPNMGIITLLNSNTLIRKRFPAIFTQTRFAIKVVMPFRIGHKACFIGTML